MDLLVLMENVLVFNGNYNGLSAEKIIETITEILIQFRNH